MQSSFLKLLTRELLATTNTMRTFAQLLLFCNLLSCLNSTMLAKYAAIKLTARSTVKVSRENWLIFVACSSGRQNYKCGNFTLLFCREQHGKSSTRCFTWGPFPETFREHSVGWQILFASSKRRRLQAPKTCRYFTFHSPYNIWKDQVNKINES